MADIPVKNDELETTRKTGDTFFDDKNDRTTTTGDDLDDDIKQEDDVSEKGEGRLTPFELSRTRYYMSQKKKEDAKTAVLSMLKYLIPIVVSVVVGLLAIFGGIWAYKLNNIAEPIGGIKVEIQYIKEDLKELKEQLNKQGAPKTYQAPTTPVK